LRPFGSGIDHLPFVAQSILKSSTVRLQARNGNSLRGRRIFLQRYARICVHRRHATRLSSSRGVGVTAAIPPGRILAANGLSSDRPGAEAPAPLHSFTTAGLPPRLQFEAWRHNVVPYLDLSPPPQAALAFEARAGMLRFGPFALYSAGLPPCDYARPAQRVRRDSLDHWMVALVRRGEQRQRSRDTVITFRTGVPYVLSMALPFEAQRSGAEVQWLALHVPRDAVPELESGFVAALSRPLDGVCGHMLGEFLCRLADGFDGLRVADLPHLAAATQSLLAAALRTVESEGSPEIERLQMARVKRLVRENLGAATLRPGRLAAMAGMSRSRLYRIFEPMGGVAQFIQRERLRQARRMLTNPAERRDIAELAEASGFFDPSSFSRAFRREFGCTPREARLSAMAGLSLPPDVLMQGGLFSVLRDL
jgi:AraC-like DNA-binding protein